MSEIYTFLVVAHTYTYVHKEQRKKLDSKTEKFTFVGYSDESRAFCLLDTKANRIKISCDVVFLDKINENKSIHVTDDEVTFSKMKNSTENDYEDVENLKFQKESSNKKFNNRTKQIDTKFHYIKDIKGGIYYQYCSTDEMPADMLTKHLAKVKLKYMTEKCVSTN